MSLCSSKRTLGESLLERNFVVKVDQIYRLRLKPNLSCKYSLVVGELSEPAAQELDLPLGVVAQPRLLHAASGS